MGHFIHDQIDISQSRMLPTKKYEISTPVRSTYHEIRGLQYHVSEWGDSQKPLLVMLHGWGDCGASFQFVVDSLQGDWLVVAPDWRGFGKTECRVEGYWFPDYIADLHALLDRYQPDRGVWLLGHSMGANIAGLYAGVMPERVAAFINVEGFGLADSDPANAPANYRRWIEQGSAGPKFSTYDNFSQLAQRVAKRSPSLTEDRAHFIAEQWGRLTANGRVELRADPAHKLPNATLYRRAEALACWAKITAPVLQISGGDSDFTPEQKTWLDPDQRLFPYPEFRELVIPGTGHMVHFEQPAALAAATEDFLARL